MGAALGLLAGLAAFALPGFGPIMGVGWLVPVLVGAAAAGGVAGGIIGSLTGAGIDENDAHVYAEGVRRGGTLVIARVDDNEAETAKAILVRSGAIDTNMRRSEYAADGGTASSQRTYGTKPSATRIPTGQTGRRRNRPSRRFRDSRARAISGANRICAPYLCPLTHRS